MDSRNTGPVPERRMAMMAVAKVTWQDQAGTVQTLTAKIEDMSLSGACIRVKTPIDVGSEVHVTWCRGQFSGTIRYCRPVNLEFLAGILQFKDERSEPILPAANPTVPAPYAPAPAKVQSISIHHPRHSARTISSAGIRAPEPPTLVAIVFPPPITDKPVIGFEIASRNPPRTLRPAETATLSSAKYQNRTSPLSEERSQMQSKWLNIGSRRQQDSAKPVPPTAPFSGNGDSPEAFPAGASMLAASGELATPQGDLLPLEDIYRAGGVVAPRMGYSILKVVEMLNNAHIRGLSEESKRASLLMALDAAGVPIDAVLQDAAQRQSVIASYESSQRRKFEEYWSRKADENNLLQAEMERVTRQYVERMNRNLNEVAQEKEVFQKWQTRLQQEIEQITEAVSLCAKSSALPVASDQPSSSESSNLVVKSA
jgi:hypothetical protein